MLCVEVKKMEIGKVSQPIEQITATTQPTSDQLVGEKNQATENRGVGQKDFQVNLQDGLKGKLAEFAKTLQNQQQLIESLPEDVRKAVVELLQQMASDAELPQGLENLLKGQKNIADQLKNMGNILVFTTALQSDEHSDIREFLQKVLANVAGQSEIVPETSAKELLQLAKQLAVNTSVAQGITKQGLEQVLKQTLPEELGQLSSQEQKIVTELTKTFGKDMPPGLQQLAQQNKIPELPGVWATLKAAEAWQFKNVQPKTLQAAAELLTELSQEMPSNLATKGTVVSQLQEFVKNLPGTITSKAAVVTELEMFAKNLSPEVGNKGAIIGELEKFIKTLPTEIGNKGVVSSQLEQFIKNMPAEIINKATMLTQLEQLVKSLPPELSNKAAAVTQMEEFIKTLPSEVGNKVAVATQLEQFIKTLPPEIGKALQHALRQGNISENLQKLADVFTNAAVLNKDATAELQKFLGKVAENLTVKSPSLPTDNSNVLGNLAKQFTDPTTTSAQLKNLIQQLKTELFANDPTLLAKEKQVLDKLTKLFEQNIPPALQEGALKHKLTELPKFWVLLKALGTEQWQNNGLDNLQKSAGIVKELAHSVYKSTGLAGEKQAEHNVLSFSVPLQVGEGIYYPAHIHIYHQNNKSKDGEQQEKQRQFETWIRVCVETQHIGTVDSVFRLYGDDKLDVRVAFPSNNIAEEFAQELPEIRKNLKEAKLSLTDIMITKA